jgi:hypothetical protein
MRNALRTAAFVAALAILMSTVAAQDKDAKGKSEAKLNVSSLSKMSGKLVNPGSEKNIVLGVTTYETVIRPRTRPNMTPKEHKFEFVPADDLIVRSAKPPLIYENGKPRKPNQKELKEAKGDPHLPGYQSELANLKKDQVITIYYEPAKKSGGKKDDAEALQSTKPKARLIVIESEPPAAP